MKVAQLRKLDLWVGCSVLLAGAAIVLYVLLTLTGFWTDKSYIIVYAEFASVAGVEAGDPVEIAGVRIGRVQSINLRGSRARLGFRIKRTARLRRDAVASIEARSFLTGDKLVEIEPGHSKKLLEPGQHIIATKPATDLTEVVVKLMTGELGSAI